MKLEILLETVTYICLVYFVRVYLCLCAKHLSVADFHTKRLKPEG